MRYTQNKFSTKNPHRIRGQVHPAVRNDGGAPRSHAGRAHLLRQDQVLRDTGRRSHAAEGAAEHCGRHLRGSPC